MAIPSPEHIQKLQAALDKQGVLQNESESPEKEQLWAKAEATAQRFRVLREALRIQFRSPELSSYNLGAGIENFHPAVTALELDALPLPIPEELQKKLTLGMFMVYVTTKTLDLILYKKFFLTSDGLKKLSNAEFQDNRDALTKLVDYDYSHIPTVVEVVDQIINELEKQPSK